MIFKKKKKRAILFFMSFPVEIVFFLKKRRRKEARHLAFQKRDHFYKSCFSVDGPLVRCVTYFTMWAELLIIKNVNPVGIMLSNGDSFCLEI